MAEFKVLRSFGGNSRGSTVDLTAADAKVLLEGERPYVEKVAKRPAKPRKRAAKKPAPEVPSES